MPPKVRPPNHQLRAGRREGAGPIGRRSRIGRLDRLDQVGDGGRDDLRLFCVVKLHDRLPRTPAGSRQVHLDRQPLGRQVHAPVVFGVAETLHVVEPHLRPPRRGRGPSARCPGAARRARGAPGGRPGSTRPGPDSRSPRPPAATAITAGTSSAIRAWVWVSWRIQHFAAQPVRQLGHLVAGMTDEVHVGVLPLERQALCAVVRIDVGDGNPAERRPGLGSERFGDDGFGVT